MELKRPDLHSLSPEVRAYIEQLEAELTRLKRASVDRSAERQSDRLSRKTEEKSLEDLPEIEFHEPPTTVNIITSTAKGEAKRTKRHLFTRQRRGGMGVFDLDADDEPPAILSTADENENLLFLTNLARVFRQPLSGIQDAPVRSRGNAINGKLVLQPGEYLAAILPERSTGYLAMLSQRGFVRLLRHHLFGESIKQGTVLFDIRTFGMLASACWTPGDAELFLATRQGKAIRFSERSVPPQGGPGIRLAENDFAVGIASIDEDSNVFLVTADGKGTIRAMETFTANKAPGAGGKIAMVTDKLVGASTVEEEDDIFLISRLSKMIRFQAGDVPVKDAPVQGVICMSLRSDEVKTHTTSSV